MNSRALLLISQVSRDFLCMNSEGESRRLQCREFILILKEGSFSPSIFFSFPIHWLFKLKIKIQQIVRRRREVQLDILGNRRFQCWEFILKEGFFFH